MDKDEDALRAALSAGADPNASVTQVNYFVPLIQWAASFGQSGMCALLVAAGADVHVLAGPHVADPDNQDVSTLAEAITGYSDEAVVTDANIACVRILLEAGADPNTRIIADGARGFYFPLHLAIEKKSDQICRLLIEHGASLELTTSGGCTALHNALFKNERKVVLTLLRAGAVPKLLRRRNILDANEALSDYMVDLVNGGGWNAHVQRHRDRLLGVISHCVRTLPQDIKRAILGFWSPPGGH